MTFKRQSVFLLSSALCLFSFAHSSRADEYANLQKILNKVDQPQDWTHSNSNSFQPRQVGNYQAPPVTPTPQAFSPPSRNSYVRPGMPYSTAAIKAFQNSPVWKYMSHASSAGPMAGQPGGNPFNLSPFGMLHYMWDDTTYVSDANPVTLYQTQNELQTAQQDSQMAQAASSRARYARNPQEREEAAQQARYYAGLAKQAAQQAQQVSESGSLNPAEVAQAAAAQANAAQNYATQASNYSSRGY